jgi:hypothetical protein
MVYIPVENTNFFPTFLGDLGRDSNVVKDTKPCKLRTLGMVARGTSDAVASIALVLENTLNALNGTEGAKKCPLVAALAQVDILALIAPTLSIVKLTALFLDHFNVFLGMDKSQIILLQVLDHLRSELPQLNLAHFLK